MFNNIYIHTHISVDILNMYISCIHYLSPLAQDQFLASFNFIIVYVYVCICNANIHLYMYMYIYFENNIKS